MNIEKFIVVQAIKTKENELIPLWDERIQFEETEDYGNIIFFKKDRFNKYYDVVECIFNIETKKLSMGIELDYYPSGEDLPYKKKESVFYELEHHCLKESKIKDIVFEKYDLTIKKGKEIEGWWKKKFENIEIENKSLYAIKSWKPFYILDNGVKIEWDHQLFHKAK